MDVVLESNVGKYAMYVNLDTYEEYEQKKNKIKNTDLYPTPKYSEALSQNPYFELVQSLKFDTQ